MDDTPVSEHIYNNCLILRALHPEILVSIGALVSVTLQKRGSSFHISDRSPTGYHIDWPADTPIALIKTSLMSF